MAADEELAGRRNPLVRDARVTVESPLGGFVRVLGPRAAKLWLLQYDADLLQQYGVERSRAEELAEKCAASFFDHERRRR